MNKPVTLIVTCEECKKTHTIIVSHAIAQWMGATGRGLYLYAYDNVPDALRDLEELDFPRPEPEVILRLKDGQVVEAKRPDGTVILDWHLRAEDRMITKADQLSRIMTSLALSQVHRERCRLRWADWGEGEEET
jgi:hypothetical protein